MSRQINVFPDEFGPVGIINGRKLEEVLTDFKDRLDRVVPDYYPFAKELHLMCCVAQRLWNDMDKVARHSMEYEHELVEGITKILAHNDMFCEDFLRVKGETLKNVPRKPECLADMQCAIDKPRTKTGEIWSKF